MAAISQLPRLGSLSIDQLLDMYSEAVHNHTAPLGTEDCMAILLYTYEFGSKNQSLYHNLNVALRSEELRVFDPFLPYAHLLQRALSRAPHFKGTVYRGEPLQKDDHRLVVGAKFQFGFFASTSKVRRVAQIFAKGLLFVIATEGAPDISTFSRTRGEQECLFSFDAWFRTARVEMSGDGRTVTVYLRHERSAAPSSS
jgi:hypothetical protein